MTTASCEAEAASRGSPQIVASCPPPDERPPVACAEQAENCSASYLRAEGLEGCCDELVCRANDAGVRVCQAATSEELELAEACQREESRRRSISGFETGLQILDPFVTSLGNIQFDNVAHDFIDSGPGGCVVAVDLTLRQGDALGCSLNVVAGPELNDLGELAVTEVNITLDECVEATTPELQDVQGFMLDDPSSGGVAFSGLSCDGGLSIESYCFAGTFSIRLTGTYSGFSSSLTLNGDVLSVAGSTCGVTRLNRCPAP